VNSILLPILGKHFPVILDRCTALNWRRIRAQLVDAGMPEDLGF
jgi:hypothetical protein